MVIVSQLDIALFSVLVKEVTSFYTIRMLLNEKTFGDENNAYDNADANAEDAYVAEAYANADPNLNPAAELDRLV